jgi:PIN domain
MTARVVFDCMVFLQGAAQPASPARACFQVVDEGLVSLCVSPAVLAEVRDVLSRPELLKRFPALSAEWVTVFVTSVAGKALVVPDVPHQSGHRDPSRIPRQPRSRPAGLDGQRRFSTTLSRTENRRSGDVPAHNSLVAGISTCDELIFSRRYFTTSNAAAFSLTNRTVFPSARHSAMTLAIVWHLPVPGGPLRTRLAPDLMARIASIWLESHGRMICSFEGWISASNLAGEGIATVNGGGVESWRIRQPSRPEADFAEVGYLSVASITPAIRRQCSCSAISVACRPQGHRRTRLVNMYLNAADQHGR